MPKDGIIARHFLPTLGNEAIKGLPSFMMMLGTQESTASAYRQCCCLMTHL